MWKKSITQLLFCAACAILPVMLSAQPVTGDDKDNNNSRQLPPGAPGQPAVGAESSFTVR